MKRIVKHICMPVLIGLLACLAVNNSVAQVLGTVATGTPPFGSFGGGPFDVVNNGNLNVHFAIPVLHKAGRGMPFTYDLSYDNSIWAAVTSGGVTRWQPVYNWGWRGQTEAEVGYVSSTEVDTDCWYTVGKVQYPGYDHMRVSNYVYHDAWGASHPFSGVSNVWSGTGGGNCTLGTNNSVTSTATDGSGYTLNANLQSGTITTKAGKVTTPPFSTGGGPASSKDDNGNEITVNSSGQFFDTLSSTTPVLTVSSAAPPSPTTFTYTAPSGAGAAYTLNYTEYTVATNFGVTSPQIAEYPPTKVPLISSIQLPDGSNYTFTYEATSGSCSPLAGTTAPCITGRINSVTLPTGGTITYTFRGGSGSNYINPDGTTGALTRLVSATTTAPSQTWLYDRAWLGTNLFSTTVTDPNNNQTVIDFSEDSNTSTPTFDFYETQRKINQLIGGTQTLLATIIKCYNGTYASCATAQVSSPITKTDVYSQLPNNSTRLSEVVYNIYGLVTDDKEYGYGVTMGSAPGNTKLIRETATIYAGLGNGIVNRPSSMLVNDWSSGSATTLSSSTYSYDQGSLTASSGTPQHVSITGSRGNLTTTTTSTSSTASLSATVTYYDTGNPNVATDVNGATTAYLYGTASCGNSFPTSISEPMSLTRSYTWSCVGGVMLTATDESGNTVTSDYSTDPDFWRPDFTLDQLQNKTTFTYQTNPTAAESTLRFNSANSVSDLRTTVDGFGRPILNQRAQTPSVTEYDTYETDYNVMGQSSRSTLPFQAAAGGTNSSAPGTTAAYDALGRPTQVTDGGGGTISYQYINNDVLQATGPAPAGENTKQKQLEYDGLGRLTSVCEITSAAGSGSCGQSNSATGFLTKYTNDALGNLLTVTQNAQPGAIGGTQTRSYTFDGLSRMTSESNPESGTTTYTYDSTSAGTCGSNYPGDLILTTKADGSWICYIHDGLHRLTDVGNNNQTSSACKRFRYDNTNGVNGSIPAGVTVHNTLGRLAEAATDGVTDEWFSYDADGRLTDVYEKTPNSGGYYHTTASYWANGALDTLGLLNSSAQPLIPMQTYGVEGEGRTSSVTASSGQNPVSSVTYTSGIGTLTNVTFGSQDSDSYQYDTNTGRMTQYSFNVNGQSAAGNLHWNANGTLQQLAITDPFNSQDNQTCNNTYDDLARLGGNNCGSVWAQTFNYDAVGNVSKSGSISWQPGYNSATNRYTLGGTSYDASGNLTADTFNTYTWDAYGDLASANGAAITYDAFGRMVENHGGTYEFVYSPIGGQPLAYTQGQSLGGAYVPLPGGAFAMYNSSALFQYNHPDWLGSARLFSTPSRGATPAMSYAPFGEGYAGGQQWVQFTSAGNAWTVAENENQTGSLEDFMFRRYSPVQGRWISPDPAGMAAVDPTNPQTWNRYAYVGNNPLSNIDPSGLACYPLEIAISGSCGPFMDNGVNFGSNWDAFAQFTVVPPDAVFVDGGCWGCVTVQAGLLQNQDQIGNTTCYYMLLKPCGGGPANNGNCGITVKCRGIQTDNLGKIGMQHCDAQVTDSSGQLWSLSGGPQPNYMSITALNAWATSPPTEPFTGTTVYQGNSCTAAGCMIQSTQAWNQDVVKPEYGPVTGPNSNTWLKGTAAGCGVSLPINTWGSIW